MSAERLAEVRKLDKEIAVLKLKRNQAYGAECLHEHVREVRFSHAPTHDSRWCKKCFLQELSRDGIKTLTSEPWRHMDTLKL